MKRRSYVQHWDNSLEIIRTLRFSLMSDIAVPRSTDQRGNPSSLRVSITQSSCSKRYVRTSINSLNRRSLLISVAAWGVWLLRSANVLRE